jgi:DNA-binding MarR family transcriptional regulator
VINEDLLQIIYKAHRELRRLEEDPRDYGTGRLFYASEIHTLACIGENPYVNLTSLAGKLGISKSAVSKFVRKLIAIGCIEKTRPRDNDKEVLCHTTPLGARAVLGHRKYQEAIFGPLREVESRLSSEQAGIIAAFLSELYDALVQGREQL